MSFNMPPPESPRWPMPERVRQAAAGGDSVVFGDAARLQALMAAGLARASAVVVTYLETPSAMKVLAHIQEHAPQVPVVVRTQDDHDLELLQHAGATEVVPEAIEGSLMLASHALALVGVPVRRVIRIVQEQRDARYKLLRGYFGGADDGSRLVVGPRIDRGLPLEAMQLQLKNVHEIAGVGTLFRDEEGVPLLHMHMACGRAGTSVTGCIRDGVKVWHVMEVIIHELLGTSAKRVVEAPLGVKLLRP